MEILSKDQILLILGRLKWEPVYEDQGIVLSKKRGIGYSDDATICQLEGKLSIMLELAARQEGVPGGPE